jgi:hypothetical protein
VHAGDDLRLAQQQQVVVALEVVSALVAVDMRGVEAVYEARAAIVGFLEAMALDHRAHGAVDDEDAFVQRGQQAGDALRMQPGKLFHRIAPEFMASSRSAK